MRVSRRTASLIAVAIASGASPSAAQTQGDDSEIVVTGTLIKGASEDAPAPVEVIDAGEMAAQGSPTAMDLARRLPASSGVIGDSSQFDPRSQFNQGSASVN
jgi:iron complex outermembrane receptor protein